MMMTEPPTLSELDGAYRERAHLVAHLAALYPSALTEESDAAGYALLYVDAPTGQLSWHIARRDLGLFGHVARVPAHSVRWDGHATVEKYRRLDELTRAVAGC